MKIPSIQQTPLRARFIISMIIMFLPLLIFAVGANISFNVMNNSLEEVVEEASDEMHPVMQLQILILESSMPLHDYLIHRNPEELQKFIRLSREVDKAFEKAFSAPFGREEEQELMRLAYKEWQKSRGISEAILSKTVLKGEPTAKQQMASLDKYINNSITILNKFHDVVTHEMHEHLAHAQLVKKRIYILVTSIFVLGLGIAFAATIVLTRSIISPLRIIEKATEHLKEGDLACRVPLDTKDEFGNLARAFNVMAARLENSQAALEEIATHDMLTDLYNRREFYQRLKMEIKRAMRYERLFSVMFVDLDLFKDVNDTYGHQTGDKVLQFIASLIRKEVRPEDHVARYGGDEFALILPETPVPSALKLAERIRGLIEEQKIPVAYGDTVSLTVSIGVASFPEDGRTDDDLISSVDNMLYAAKGTGRNKVYSTGKS